MRVSRFDRRGLVEAWILTIAGLVSLLLAVPHQAFAQLPDLTIPSFSVTPSKVKPGDQLTITISVKNRGMGKTAASYVALFGTTDGATDLTDAAGPVILDGGPLDPGTLALVSLSFSVPPIQPGLYAIWAKADPDRNIAESREKNNNSVKRSVEVVGNPSPSPLTVWVVDSLTRVQPTDQVGTLTSASIKAARNEYEAFQVIIAAPAGQSLSNVNATVSDLTGPGTITKNNITLYREHYIHVRAQSAHVNNGWFAPHPPGDWPDALIPSSVPGGTYSSFPFSVQAGRNQPVWIEVYVPKDTTPGTYTGSITVTAQGQPPATIPLTLTVWGFTLPDRPALKSDFGIYDKWFIIAAQNSQGANQQALMDNLYAALDAHRLGIGRASLRTYEDIEFMDSWMLTHRFIQAPWDATDPELESLRSYFDSKGWTDFLGYYIYDEPDSQTDYDAIWAEAPRWRAKGIPTMTTIKIDTAWAALDGAIDIWVPVFYECIYSGAQIANRLAKGEKVWSYTAGVQPNESPTWLLDYDLIHFRIPAWLNYRHGQSGLLYWATAYWEAGDPWTNAANQNGEGLLFYPGSAVGAPDAVIPSTRLKVIRDGMEDYDYLALLATLGDPDLAASLAATFAPAWNSWSHDPAVLAAVREQAANRISSLLGLAPTTP